MERGRGRECVITGIGIVSSLGETATATWTRLLDGASGAGPITQFDPESAGIRAGIACEVNKEDENTDTDTNSNSGAGVGAGKTSQTHETDRIDDRTMGRYAQFAVAATGEAVADAGFDPGSPGWEAERVGTSIGSGLAGLSEIEAAAGERPSPSFLVTALTNLAAGHVSICFDAKGPNRAPGTACSAGTHAIAAGVDDIRRGRADVVIAGGTDATISPLGVGSFDAMRALSTRTEDPTAASRPFDADRDGLVLAEGSGIVVLESREHARERGVSPYAAITGTGRTADAHHTTRPAKSGAGLRRCLEQALAEADRAPAAVDHINAHATSTPVGDAREAAALSALFDERDTDTDADADTNTKTDTETNTEADTTTEAGGSAVAETTVPPVTSIKGQLGHALGAAGAIEAAIVARTIATDTIPPTINYETPDPECDLPVVTTPRETTVDLAVSTSAGFGGTNGTLVFEQP